MKELISSIVQKHNKNGIDINPSASIYQITDFENQIGFTLPDDFRKFYLILNGFGCNEDIFNMISLEDITEFDDNYGGNWFYFAEYMIYSDMWGMRLSQSKEEYEIFNGSYPEKVMTFSLIEFLKRFLNGNVFESGGLYDWHEELGMK